MWLANAVMVSLRTVTVTSSIGNTNCISLSGDNAILLLHGPSNTGKMEVAKTFEAQMKRPIHELNPAFF